MLGMLGLFEYPPKNRSRNTTDTALTTANTDVGMANTVAR